MEEIFNFIPFSLLNYVIIYCWPWKIQIRENVGAESKEATKYFAKMEERARQEEELFTRAPLTKAEKTKMKHLTKSRNGWDPRGK